MSANANAMDRMLSKMSKMYPMMIVMGLMIVAISFIIGFVNSQLAADYFSIDKTTRDTLASSNLRDDRGSIESVGLWLPYFKFLGLGLLLGGIVMALRVIIDNLRDVGEEVLSNLDEAKRPKLPTPPWYALLMPMLMMVGEIIFIVALIIALGLASNARTLFGDNQIIDIDTNAGLTSDLSDIKTVSAWLVPLKFLAIATEFLAIAIGLATIIYILSAQTKTLDKAFKVAEGGN
ncbi:MAG: hypothetical protein HeimC2_07100 [Candidatus Heimdallarchaeota archaeon LC_2]|nr:MAG: hypothetical protein HeimC2_07100 [Candidatus Heimdallarchaeota archaeon LC_2]